MIIYVGDNDTLRRLVFEKLTKLGYKHHAISINDLAYGYITIKGEENNLLRNNLWLSKKDFIEKHVSLGYENPVDAAEFLSSNFNLKPNVTIILNNEYKAIVDFYHQTIKVGCQNFPFEKVVELYNLIKDESKDNTKDS